MIRNRPLHFPFPFLETRIGNGVFHSPLHMKLDVNKLDEVVLQPEGCIRARCPACRSQGRDNGASAHLWIYPNGRFGCAAHQGDRNHKREILRLAASAQGQRAFPFTASRERINPAAAAARANLGAIVRKFADPNLTLLLRDNPHSFAWLFKNSDPRYFLSCLFPPDAIIWTGRTTDSGAGYSNSWKRADQLRLAPPDKIRGPFTTPAVWPEGTTSRARKLVLWAPYVVLDFDEIDGIKPDSPSDIHRLFQQSIALIRWIRSDMGWSLAAIVQTGNKSLHAWFHKPAIPEAVPSLKSVCKVLGVDETVDNPSQPCRLPGQIHHKSGKLSRLLWLQRPESLPEWPLGALPFPSSHP